MKLTLIAKKPLTSDVTSFVFEPESPLDICAGQYFHYVLPHPDADAAALSAGLRIRQHCLRAM